ncbi:MAG: hypothetical protein ACI88C_000827 [Acidimicrobiales bacterium]|jgi:hypothetical protein
MHSTTGTPTAWQITFATADRQQPSVALDPILGMSAHVNRDLAYTAPALAAGDPNLREQPDDYLCVNDVIAGVKSPTPADAACRFDPSLFLLNAELTPKDAPEPVTPVSDCRAFSFDLGLRLATEEKCPQCGGITSDDF